MVWEGDGSMKPLEFQAIKHKFIDDEDGEAIIMLKINQQEKLGAFAIPPKKLLKITVEVIDG